ncbi:MAG: T9SS type A sorting domain-containing protein [Crocinitomicaceae bacterium]
MRNLLFLISLFAFSNSYFAQWQQIYDLAEVYDGGDIFGQAMEFYSEDYGAILSLGMTSSATNISYSKILITKDGGQSWDSTIFYNTTGSLADNLKMPTDSIIYFCFLEQVYPVGAPSYAKTGVKRSLDQGTTWTTHWIDTNYSAGLPDNSLFFLNDSMGIYCINQHVFFTKDYAESWEEISNQSITNTGGIIDKFVLYNFGFLHQYDPFADTFTSMPYSPNCEGQVDFSNFRNNKAYRTIFAQDGPQQGYTNNNYGVLIIDELPFGDQRVIHFPNMGHFGDLELSEHGIFLQIAGVIFRSWDDGASFEQLPIVATSTGIGYLDMINDTVGYALTLKPGINFNPNYELWKTTNGGGLSGTPITIHSFIEGVGISEISQNFAFQIYPNPSQGQFILRSETLLERMEVFNLLGEKIMGQNVQHTEVTLDLANYESGIYFVRAFSADGLAEQRIVLAK